MNEYDFGSATRSQKRSAQRSLEDRMQHFLRAEAQLLQSISDGGPLREVLNRICSALDCQIGNVVSLISLPGHDATVHAEIARIAALFGLHAFCSAGVVAENGELLGSLEVYCCVPRSTSAGEFRLIEWAKCLAATAIKSFNGADRQANCGIRGNRTLRGRVLEWPVSAN
jgi:hypothetical protein